jgi:hypothetical protein
MMQGPFSYNRHMTISRELRLAASRTGFSGCDISANIYLPQVTDRRGNPINVGNSGGLAYQLGSIQTLSISTYDDKNAVRGLGQKGALGYARGHYTVAGTLMFNQMFDRVFDDKGRGRILDDRGGVLTYSSGGVYYDRRSDPELLQRVLDMRNPNDQIRVEDRAIQAPDVNRRHLFDFAWDHSRIGRVMRAGQLPPFDIICLFVNEIGNVGKIILYGVDIIHESTVLSVEDIYTEVSYQYVARDVDYFAPVNAQEAEEWRSRVLYLQDFDVGMTDSDSQTLNRVIDRARSDVRNAATEVSLESWSEGIVRTL